jgi:hypothetical protein
LDPVLRGVAIAFHENRKRHDLYMEALREYLERKGHTLLVRATVRAR